MSASRSIILIAPAHNEELLLRQRVAEIIQYSKKYPLRALIIAENGSTDQTAAIAKELSLDGDSLEIHSLHLQIGDYGAALAESMKYAGEHLDVGDPWLLLSAIDLPFSMSDTEAFLALNLTSNSVVLGSKGHPQSQIQRSFKRTVLSKIFFLLRKVFLSLPYKDTQGTVFLPLHLAQAVLPTLKTRGFFFTTELIYRLHKMNCPIHEVPVILRPEDRDSKVRWFRDGSRMLKSTAQLSAERIRKAK